MFICIHVSLYSVVFRTPDESVRAGDVSKGNPLEDVHGTAEPKTDFLAPHHTSLCGDQPELQRSSAWSAPIQLGYGLATPPKRLGSENSDVVDLSSIVEQFGRLIRQEVAIDHRRQGQVVDHRNRMRELLTWKLTLAPPADSPKMVMLSGSPPNVRMFLCTQAMAACWSHRP
ncbi:hypothetical protein EYF80_046258 [Liparis tanakae]|uniref:Uncharacterized protein n=1 Tax=Liparis tanakae TaxID=230148 RepID=A0A4Z2FQM8_9TELE|nr:hypothetical protein EYF80_046258 [Liparis tanakae]